MKNLRFFKPVVCASTNPLGTNFLRWKGLVIKMAEWIFLIGAALPVTELYARTKHPKRNAVLNGLLGTAALIGSALLLGESPEVNPFAAAVSAVLGVPGAALVRALPYLLS